MEYEARQRAIRDYDQMMWEVEERGREAGEGIGREAGEKQAGERINELDIFVVMGMDDLKEDMRS